MVRHSRGTVLVRHLRHVRRRYRARRASQRQGGGGINGKSQDRRPVCQNAGDPQAGNSRGQASKIKVVSTSLSERAQAWRMRKLAPTKSDSCGQAARLEAEALDERAAIWMFGPGRDI